VGREVIVAGLVDRTVVLLERATGTPFWRTRVAGTVRGTPLLAGDRVYVASEESPFGFVYALQLRDGRPAWRVRAGDIAAPLALAGDALYAASTRGLVRRLRARDGREVWQQRLTGAVHAAPLSTVAGLVVATAADSLYLLDPASGAVRARRGTPGTVLAAPVTDGAHLYLATASGTVLAVDGTDLRTLWGFALPDAVYGAPALAGDSLYVLARDGTLAVVPTADSSRRRTVTLGVVAVAGPTVLRDGVVVGTVTGDILCVDAGDGTVRWRTRVTAPIESAPVVHDGQLVVVGGRGEIEAFR
jgi:outer membrane protein assembly factor BamB